MAIDTARKRASLVGYGLPFRLMLPPADATISLGDRQHLVGLYAGIAVVPAVPPLPVRGFVLRHERQGFQVADERAGVVLRAERNGFILRG